MGVELHAVLEFYGIMLPYARGIEEMLRNITTNAELQGSHSASPNKHEEGYWEVPQRIHISLVSEDQQGVQARLRGIYKVLKWLGRDYEVLEVWAHNGKEIAEVI